MQGKNHFVVGLSAVLLTHSVTGFVQPHTVAGITANSTFMLGLALGVATVGAFLPDIDLATSEAAYHTGTGRGQGGCLLGLVFAWGRRLLGGHRGLTHTLWAMLVCAGLFGFNLGHWSVTWPGLLGDWSDMGTAFVLGYISHILADMLTKEGVRFWYPFAHAEVGLGSRGLRFETGSWVEYAVVVALVALTLWRWFM